MTELMKICISLYSYLTFYVYVCGAPVYIHTLPKHKHIHTLKEHEKINTKLSQ